MVDLIWAVMKVTYITKLSSNNAIPTYSNKNKYRRINAKQTIILCCYTVPIQQSFIKSDGKHDMSSNEGHLYKQVIF
jgi:hypothetical protein